MYFLIMNKEGANFNPCVVFAWETCPTKREVELRLWGKRLDDCDREGVTVSEGLEVFANGHAVGAVKRIRTQPGRPMTNWQFIDKPAGN